MRLARFLALIIGAFMVIGSPPAWGHTQTRLDPDDSPGPLDLAAARHSHRTTDSGKVILKFRLVTYEKWRFGDNAKTIYVEFNLDGDQVIERCAVVSRRWVEPGVFRVEGDVYKNCDYFQEERIGAVRSVSRPDAHSVKISLAKRLLGNNVDAYKWRIVTGYQDPQSEDCKPYEPPPGEPVPDGGYETCTDFSRWTLHEFH